MIATLVWQWTPFMMLILLAGLQSQSRGRPGGGPGGRRERLADLHVRMTLPYLRPYLELGALLGSIYLVQTFDAVFTITQGGPGTATTNLPYEIYLTTFRKFEYGEAAAAGVVVVIGTIIVATFALRVISEPVPDGGEPMTAIARTRRARSPPDGGWQLVLGRRRLGGRDRLLLPGAVDGADRLQAGE